MTTSRMFRHLGVIALLLFEAILILGLTRGYDEWRGFAFGFALAMLVLSPLMFFLEFRDYRRTPQE